MEDDGPYQPQCQLWVSIGDVIVPDIDQFDLKGGIFVYEQTWVWSKRKKAKCKQTKQGGKANGMKYTFNTMCKLTIRDLSVFEEVQGDLHILQLVEAHPSLLPWLQETRGRQASGGGSAGRQDVWMRGKQKARPHDWRSGVFKVQPLFVSPTKIRPGAPKPSQSCFAFCLFGYFF